MRRIRFVTILSCSEIPGPAGRWLPFCELKAALVPFTDVCDAEMMKANRCTCGCWVAIEPGISTCPFCGATVNRGLPTSFWKRIKRVKRIESGHEVIASTVEDPEAYLIRLEQFDYERDWENQNE